MEGALLLAGIRSRLTYANVMATIAVFIALGGVAWAAATINSKDVVDNSLKSVDLKDGKGVKSADVKDDGLSGADIDEASLEGVDAASFDDLPRGDYVFRSFTSSPTNRNNGLAFYAYTMVTPEAGTNYVLGQVQLRTTSNPSEFQVCGATGLSDPVPYVLYIEGARSEDSVGGMSCDTAVNFGDTCDFEILASGARGWGSPLLGSTDDCELLALQSS